MEFARQNIGTLLRLLFCALVFWLFTVGSYTAPINLETALIVSVMLGLMGAYELSIRSVPPAWVFGVFAAPFVIILPAFLWWLALQPPPPTGGLIAAGEPMPLLRCSQKPGANDLAVFFGTDVVIGKGPGPFTPLIVDDCPALSLLRQGGRLMVQGFGYDANGNILFRIRDNIYSALDTAELRVFRPDASTFVLLNRYDREVIYVRYLNAHAVRLRGHFLCGDDVPQAVIRDDRIIVGGFMIRGALFGGHATKGHVCAVADARNPSGIVVGIQKPEAQMR